MMKTNIFVLAMLSLRRRLVNSILSLVLFTIFIIMIAATASIATDVSIQAKEYAATLGSSFSLSLAPATGGGHFEEREMEIDGTIMKHLVYVGPKITKGLVEKISEVEGIIDYNIIDSALMETQLSLFPGLSSDINENWEEIGFLPDDHEIAESVYQKRFTSIHFVLRSELHPYFQNGAFSLVSGEHITNTDENVALISEFIAEQNNLNIGDIITLSENAGYFTETMFQFDKILGEPIPVKIIGIYRINFAQEPSVYTPESHIADNFIFSDMTTAMNEREIVLATKGAVLEEFSEIPVGKTIFFVDSPDTLDRVIQNVRDMDELGEIPYLLEKDTIQYEAMVTPLNTIRNFTVVVLVALIICCIVVSGLIQGLFARSRAREAGTFLALGFSKKEITAHRVAEFSILCVFATVIAILLIQHVVGAVGAFSINTLFPADSVIDYSIYYDETAHENVISVSSGKPVGIEFGTGYKMIILAFLLTWTPGVFFLLKSMKNQFKKPPRKIIDAL